LQTHQEILHQALELRAQIEDLKSATYIVDNFEDSHGTPYMFIASFSLTTLEYAYQITDGNFVEIKGISHARPETMAAYGEFVSAMMKYVAGGEHPYTDKLAGFAPEVIKPHDTMQQVFEDDQNVDDSEASLT
jgi:hypothetical protein